MQEITRFEADELVFNHDIVDQNFYQDKKAMRFDFTLGNDQFLIVIYNHDTKEKSYFVVAYKNIEEQTKTQFEGEAKPQLSIQMPPLIQLRGAHE